MFPADMVNGLSNLEVLSTASALARRHVAYGLRRRAGVPRRRLRTFVDIACSPAT